VDSLHQRKRFRDFVQYAVQDLDSDIQQRTFAYVDAIQGDELRSFSRYFYEGWLKFKEKGQSGKPLAYHSEGLSSEILKGLLSSQQLEFKGAAGVDFGCGTGEVLKALSHLGAKMTGFDISPFFIQNIRAQGLQATLTPIDRTLDLFNSSFALRAASQSFAVATLVLDRLSHPQRFLVNLFHALKPRGVFSIQTLLPIVPQDDGPVERPIIYTPPDNRITAGVALEEDKLSLLDLLKKLGGEKINVKGLSYSVTSLDGVQNYTLWSFSGRKTG
jgi:SAM-dependent methyltransferase